MIINPINYFYSVFSSRWSLPKGIESPQNVTLTITPTGTLEVDLNTYSITIENGGGIHIQTGGSLAQTGKLTPPQQEPSSDQLIYHHTDHLSGASVDTDNNGKILQLTDYYPYGNERIEDTTTDFHNDYTYTGKERDEDTDLLYYEARYYNSNIARFISIDPWEGDLTDPQSLNKYAYVRNNPLKYVDPDGKIYGDTFNSFFGFGLFSSEEWGGAGDVLKENISNELNTLADSPEYVQELAVETVVEIKDSTVEFVEENAEIVGKTAIIATSTGAGAIIGASATGVGAVPGAVGGFEAGVAFVTAWDATEIIVDNYQGTATLSDNINGMINLAPLTPNLKVFNPNVSIAPLGDVIVNEGVSNVVKFTVSETVNSCFETENGEEDDDEGDD